MALVKDDGLAGDTVLWRRIVPNWIYEENGRYRPQSIALVDRHTGEVSVFVAHLTDESTVMHDYPDQSLIAFKAQIVLDEGCSICRNTDDPNPAHRLLCHSSQSVMRRIGKKVSQDFHWVRLLKPPPT